MLVLIGAGCAPCLVGCGGPIWLVHPPSAEQVARRDNRPLLLYFKAWDSGQHRDMNLQVLSHPSVKQELMDTVNVEVEFGWWPEWQERYHVETPQVCVMCDPRGEEVDRTFASPVPAAEEFLRWLRLAKAKAKPPETQAPTTDVPQMPPSAPPPPRRQPATPGPTHP